MMDASINLMNQYVMISAQFPPIPTPSTSTTQQTETTNVTETQAKTSKKTDDTTKTTEKSHENDVAGPSTAPKTSSIETHEIGGNIVTIEDIGHESDEMSEIRRRRLQKFETKTEDS